MALDRAAEERQHRERDDGRTQRQNDRTDPIIDRRVEGEEPAHGSSDVLLNQTREPLPTDELRGKTLEEKGASLVAREIIHDRREDV